MTALDALLTTEELAAWTRVSIQTIIRMVDAGDLRAFRIGRAYRYRIEWVQAAWPDADGVSVEEIQAAHKRWVERTAERAVS